MYDGKFEVLNVKELVAVLCRNLVFRPLISMEQEHRNLITRNINLLLEPTVLNYEIIRPHLLEKKIFTLCMIRDIDDEKTEVEKLRKLLTDLCTRGPLAFHKFIDILVKTKQFAAIKIILPNENNYNLEQTTETREERSEVDNYAPHSVCLPGGSIKEQNYQRIAKVKLATNWIERDDCYKMSSAPRGLCFILNNVDFTSSERERREGSETNANLLEIVFKDLGYTIDRHKNKTADEMTALLEKFASRQEHYDLDSCVVILMSHGAKDAVEGINSKLVYLNDVYDLFNNANCPALIDKPKIFVINACRGGPVDYGAPLPPNRKVSCDGTPFRNQSFLTRRPTITDMLICYCTIEGYGAVRDPEYGSWFIHYLVRVLLNKACDTDLYTMLQEVDRDLQKAVGRDGEKQSAELVNRGFSKKLYFNPGLYK